METSSVGNVSQGNTATTSANNNTIADFDTFLRLFVNQLKNQDPLSPMDGEALLGQTAQFTSVEQLVSLNRTMSELSETIGSSTWATAAALIGRSIEAIRADAEGVEEEVSGRVVEIYAGSDGELVLGLEDGSSVPLYAVDSISESH